MENNRKGNRTEFGQDQTHDQTQDQNPNGTDKKKNKK